MPFDNAYAVVVGTGTYTYARYANIPKAVADAQAVHGVLLDGQYCGYAPERVTLLTEADANREKILATLKQLAAQVPENGTIFFSYTGHGTAGDDGHYYLTTYDTRLEKGKVKAGTGISDVDLMAALKACKNKRLLIIINACYSGALAPQHLSLDDQPLEGKTLPDNTANALLGTGEGRILITACRPTQSSWVDLTKPLSLFGQAVVDGLRGDGPLSAPNGGYISAFNLYENVFEAAKMAAAQLPLPKEQEPMLTVVQGVGPFPVALYQGASNLGNFSPEALPQGLGTRPVPKAWAEKALEKHLASVQMQSQITGDGNTVVEAINSTVNIGTTTTYVRNVQASAPGSVAVGGAVHGNVKTNNE